MALQKRTLRKVLALPSSATLETRLVADSFLGEVEALSGLDESTLQNLTSMAVSAMAIFCRLPSVDGQQGTWARNSYIETQYRVPSPDIQLSMRPAKVASVTIDDELIDPSKYICFSASGVIELQFCVSRCSVVVIEYDAGYVTPYQDTLTDVPIGPPLPQSLLEALKLTAQAHQSVMGRADVGAERYEEGEDDVGDVKVQYPSGAAKAKEAATAVPPFAAALLQSMVLVR